MSNFRDSPALILLSGLPGTGKTTFARRLGGVLSFEHVESDAIRRSIAQRPTYSSEESGAVFRKAEDLAARALAEGRHALIDATNLSNRDRKRFIRLADRTAATFIAVRLTAPDAVIRERLAKPREGWSQADLAVYELMRGRGQPFPMPALVVDTRFDVRPAIELVVRLAGAER